MSSDQSAVTASPHFAAVVREERLSDKVASALRASIFDGTLEVGSKLPSERILCDQFGVSRPVVREAVRSLIAQGLLVAHPRRGHVIATVKSESVSDSLTLLIRGRHLDYDKVGEIRRLVEVEMAGLAAERGTPELVAAVGVAAELLVDGLSAADAAEVDVEFHRAVAVATANEFFVILVDSLREVMLEIQLPTLADPRIIKTARNAHKKIAATIESGDPELARAAMRAHLDLATKQMRALVESTGGSVRVS